MKKVYLTSISQTESGDGYTMEVCYDFVNERIRIDDYQGSIAIIARKAKQIAKMSSFTKLIIKAQVDDWRLLVSQGFLLEGIIEGYFKGSDAFLLVYYLADRRRATKEWKKEDDLIEKICEQQNQTPKKLTIPAEYQIRIADVNDANSLTNLYKEVFSSYPTPLNDETYVREIIQKESSVFLVVEWKGSIVSAASAELNNTFKNAEMTDCATLPEHRKYGFMQLLLSELETELKKRKIYCAYSLARAGSYGMNACLKKLDYKYNGRLLNNCFINEKYEDMNVWVKKLA